MSADTLVAVRCDGPRVGLTCSTPIKSADTNLHSLRADLRRRGWSRRRHPGRPLPHLQPTSRPRTTPIRPTPQDQGDPVTAPTEITYCANGCKTAGKLRALTNAPSKLCSDCEGRLHQWLTKLPELYALLPTFMEPGTADPAPGAKATKRAEVPAPIRLDVVDLLDHRFGRIWLGTAPAHDRRGVAGVLLSHAERLREERRLPASSSGNLTFTTICALLDRHRFWLAEQDWITELYEDIKQLHRAVSDAVGEYRRPPVGRCHVDADDQGTTCGGKLFANDYGGVRCANCHATWDAGELRILGLALAQTSIEEAG